MRNRAKCKKCGDIIESFHRQDFVECSCTEICIDGGSDIFHAAAKDWANFLRVDDNDNEIIVTVIDKKAEEQPKPDDVKPLDMPKLNRADKMKALEEMIKSYESLPQHALIQPCTHYDVLSVLLLLKSLSED